MAIKPWLELPVAFLSVCFYKLNKFVIGNLYTIYLARASEKSKQWQILSAAALQKNPLALLVLMTKAPRWNTHAIIGTLGPMLVASELTIDLACIRQSTQSWVGCVYDFPSYRTVLDFETLGDNPEQSSLTISLPKGKYTLGLRYYHPFDEIQFPTVQTDLGQTVEPATVAKEINNFYQTLAQKTNLYFLSLHYYIFTLMKLRKLFPDSVIKSEFLPVGATDTKFFYGALNPQESLEIKISAIRQSQYRFYLTFYNRASFPLTWQQLTEDKVCPALGQEVYYLIRMRPNSLEAAEQITQVTGTEISNDGANIITLSIV